LKTPLIKEEKLLSDQWYVLKKYVFDYPNAQGKMETQSREVYDRGNGAAILLYDPTREKILLTRQFRMPTYVNGNKDGLLIEACAGVLDGESPLTCVKREAEEETGYRVSEVKKVSECYMSPGAVTEIIHLFTGIYSSESKVGAGGGLASEHENIEVLEFSYAEAREMLLRNEIRDGKTLILFQHAKIAGIL
jgi:GDP-mannose pyrophosphatase NudK